MKHLKAAQDILRVEHHPGGLGGSPTSWGILYEDHHVSKIHQACIAGLTRNYPDPLEVTGKTAFYIWHQAKDTPKNRKYLDYILGPDSPWRDLISAQEPQDFEFIFKYGYVLTNLKFPTNYLVNFLVAFRLSYEKPYCIDLWIDMIESEVLPGTSLMFTSQCSSYVKGKLIWVVDTGHNAFSLQNADKGTWDRVNLGKPDKNNMSNWTFTDSHDFLPNNVIWIKSKDMYNQGELLSDLYAFEAKNRGKKSNQIFPSPNGRREITFEVLRDFALELDSTKEKAA